MRTLHRPDTADTHPDTGPDIGDDTNPDINPDTCTARGVNLLGSCPPVLAVGVGR